ncbi:MAG: tRNA (N(6)-L-threonylcarbamoyladenosine(37)-C(2))-methylthiotransferase MtaB [Leptospiraceae bacterium]|nr:tRNA (N(6)-L-threonylcarbamoyladenosine(37)-C(2))-methylthiotransferase MtaB [Leptospiraceae bacterium]
MQTDPAAADGSETGKQAVYINTFGCRLNQYESDGIVQSFVESGRYRQTGQITDAAVLIVNSCTVTSQADQKCLQFIRRARRDNPALHVVVTGCFAQTDRAVLSTNPAIDLVCGNDQKSDLLDRYEQWLALQNRRAHNLASAARQTSPFAYGVVKPQGHTRAYLKIQDGCDRRCSYCKIPMARGRGSSRAATDILEHVKALEDAGVPEIVLTGVNLGWYRELQPDKSRLRFIGLLEKILESMQFSRLRLSSIEPSDVGRGLAELSQHPRFCNYLHVPLQSGARNVLKAMRRSYDPTSFARRIETVRQYNPGVFIGTDVMVGFPAESEAEFQESMSFCKSMQFAGLHLFPYSRRAGTEAARRTEQWSRQTIKERMQQFGVLRRELQVAYQHRCLGRTFPCVLEQWEPAARPDASIPESGQGPIHRKSAEWAELLSDNYLRIRVPANQLIDRRRDHVHAVQALELAEERFVWGQMADPGTLAGRITGSEWSQGTVQ